MILAQDWDAWIGTYHQLVSKSYAAIQAVRAAEWAAEAADVTGAAAAAAAATGRPAEVRSEAQLWALPEHRVTSERLLAAMEAGLFTSRCRRGLAEITVADMQRHPGDFRQCMPAMLRATLKELKRTG